MTADYTYDGLERLAIRATQNMTPSGTTHYVYDRSGRLIAEAASTRTTVREYIWLDDLPLAVISYGCRFAPSFLLQSDQSTRTGDQPWQ